MVFSLRFARGGDQPADRQRLAALGAHFDGHLVGGATDPARAHLDGGLMLSSASWKTSIGAA
jgi:hypothetical protein